MYIPCIQHGLFRWSFFATIRCLTPTLICARWGLLSALLLRYFEDFFIRFWNAGKALHLEVRIRPSPSLQATPVSVLKIVPEYPHVITILKYSALLNWSLSSVYIRGTCYYAILRRIVGDICMTIKESVGKRPQYYFWHSINSPFQENICHCCLNRRWSNISKELPPYNLCRMQKHFFSSLIFSQREGFRYPTQVTDSVRLER